MIAQYFDKVAFLQHLTNPYVAGTLVGAGLGGAEAAYNNKSIGQGMLGGGAAGLASVGLVRGANKFLGSQTAQKVMADAKATGEQVAMQSRV